MPGLRGVAGRMGKAEVALIASGIGIIRARETAVRVLNQTHEVERIIITGVAGALHHDLRIGDVVVAERLWLRRGDEFAIEHALEVDNVSLVKEGLVSARIIHRSGAMLTSRAAIVAAADKRQAYETLGALAVDMESAVIAREAHLRRLPFVCLRTILDTAAQNLEAAILANENGRIRPLNVASALARNPRLIAASMRLMRNLKIATGVMVEAIDSVLQHCS